MLTRDQIATVTESAKRAIRSISSKNPGRIGRADEDDLLSETYVKVLTSFDASRGDIAGFAYRLAANESIDFLRNARGSRRDDQRMVSTDKPVGEDGATVGQFLADQAPNPLQALAAKRRNLAIASAIADLSADRKAAVLASLEDESLNGAQRVNKLRAIEDLQSALVA